MEILIIIIPAVIISIFVFIILREIFCWYWKINRSIELQEEILNQLKKLNGEKQAQAQRPPIHNSSGKNCKCGGSIGNTGKCLFCNEKAPV